jgi:putative multiple sugar transport system substrate-binding protein
MKKWVLSALVIALVLLLVACVNGDADSAEEGEQSTQGAATGSSGKPKVGVSMPTKSLQRWNQDGTNLKAQLENAGYEVDLQYAGDQEIPLQVTQLEDMISGGCSVLVVAAIDGEQVDSPMQQAKEANIPVVSYDRLIRNSDAVSYYASFDNERVGRTQGQAIVDALDLTTAKGPFNIEIFTGDSADNNVRFFFNGAMSVLQPYIDSGVLRVPSGQVTQAQCATEAWSPEESQARMENLVASQGYGPYDVRLDAVLSTNDSIAQGITNALLAAGYTKKDFPFLTGQDCDVASMKNMLKGFQSMSIFKDTRILADQTVKMVDAILKGEEPELNNTTDYDNGTGVIPAYLCTPITCTLDNYRELLIDSGYYTEDQLR